MLVKFARNSISTTEEFTKALELVLHDAFDDVGMVECRDGNRIEFALLADTDGVGVVTITVADREIEMKALYAAHQAAKHAAKEAEATDDDDDDDDIAFNVPSAN